MLNPEKTSSMFEPVHVRLPISREEASPTHRQIWYRRDDALRHLEIPTLPMRRDAIAAVLPSESSYLRILEESLPPGLGRSDCKSGSVERSTSFAYEKARELRKLLRRFHEIQPPPLDRADSRTDPSQSSRIGGLDDHSGGLSFVSRGGPAPQQAKSSQAAGSVMERAQHLHE